MSINPKGINMPIEKLKFDVDNKFTKINELINLINSLEKRVENMDKNIPQIIKYEIAEHESRKFN